MVEVWQEKFVVIADPGGVEYDAGQIEELMAARFKERAAETTCPHFERPAVKREAEEEWGERGR